MLIEPGPVVLVTTAGEKRQARPLRRIRLITVCLIVLDCVNAWVDEKEEHPKFFHAVGDGTFVVDGETISYREIMIDKLPLGV
jgi:hypothetical protein